MSRPIPVFNGLDEKDRQRLAQSILGAYSHASEIVTKQADAEEESPEDQIGPTDEGPIEIPEHPHLIGLDPSVYRQINAAIQSGKQHLVLYGPPGTGKTELARHIASHLHERWRMITGSADWTSQDVIGGYQPVGEGQIRFVPGVLLQNFDRPLIIDELNRCDIDKRPTNDIAIQDGRQRYRKPSLHDLASAQGKSGAERVRSEEGVASHRYHQFHRQGSPLPDELCAYEAVRLDSC
jgi:hypothetical protein